MVVLLTNKKSPFNPTFGNVPKIYLGKDQPEELASLIQQSDFDMLPLE